jgi:hypothetical protein
MPISIGEDNTHLHFITRNKQGEFNQWVGARIGRMAEKSKFVRAGQGKTREELEMIKDNCINQGNNLNNINQNQVQNTNPNQNTNNLINNNVQPNNMQVQMSQA